MSIHAACERGSFLQVKELVESGTNVDTLDEKGRTPLYIACAQEHENIASYLIKNGAKINATFGPLEESLLCSFAKKIHNLSRDSASVMEYAKKYERICLFLIQHNADCHQHDKEGLAPIHYAALGGNIPVFRKMLKASGNIAYRSFNGLTALHCACMDSSRQGYALLKLILEGDEDFPPMKKITHREIMSRELGKKFSTYTSLINAPDINGQTPLHTAAQSSLIVVNMLIDAGAKLVPDFSGKTPLDYIEQEVGYFRTHPKITEALQAAFPD